MNNLFVEKNDQNLNFAFALTPGAIIKGVFFSSSNHIPRIRSHGTRNTMGKTVLYSLRLIWDPFDSSDVTFGWKPYHRMDYSNGKTI